MHTSLQLIDLAKQRLGLKHNLPAPMTDYRLGKLLGIHQGTFSSWRTGRTRIGTEFVRKFADACELSEAYVYACIEHERATPEVKSVLEQIAAAFSGKAAAALLSTVFLWLGGSLLDGNQASAAVIDPIATVNTIHYAKYRAWLRRLVNRLKSSTCLPLFTDHGRYGTAGGLC